METTTTPTLRVHLRVAGWVPDDWTERFEGIALRHPDEASTVLVGAVKDQSALFGILRAVEARGMKLLAAVVRCAAVLALLFLTAGASAETLPFDAALRRALEANPEVVRARAEVGAARAQKRLALSAVLPRLDVDAFATRNREDTSFQPQDDRAVRLTLSQPLYLGGRAARALDQAALSVQAAEAAQAAAEERVLFAAATDYLSLLAADARIDVELRNVALAAARREHASRLLEAGEATKVDVLRAEAAQKAAERQLAAARQARTEAQSRLRIDLALEGEIEAIPASALPEMPGTPELLARAAAHPELARAADLTRIAQLETKRQRGAYLPSVFLGATASRQRSSFPYENPSSISLSVRLPLFDGGETAARVAIARRHEEEAAVSQAEVRQLVREQVLRAAAALEAARTSSELAKEQLAAVEAEHAQVSALYRAQEATSLDIDAAEAALAEARRAVVTESLASQIAGLRVLYAAGSLESTLLKKES